MCNVIMDSCRQICFHVYGSQMKKVVPVPTSLSNHILPLCKLTMSFTIDNPSPVDFSCAVPDLPAVENGRKIISLSVSGIPIPESLILIQVPPSGSFLTLTRMEPPLLVNFNAFVIFILHRAIRKNC